MRELESDQDLDVLPLNAITLKVFEVEYSIILIVLKLDLAHSRSLYGLYP